MNVLVIRSGGLGDCLLILPVIHRIRQHHADTSVTVLGNAMMREVAGLTGWIDACHDLDDPRFARLYADAPLTDELRHFFTPFTHVYCFSSTPEPEHLAARIQSAGACSCTVLDPRPPDRFSGHMVSHFMSIVPGAADCHYPVDEKQQLIGTITGKPAHGRLVVHPGSGSPTKNWPLERFLAVAEWWEGDAVVIFGPAEIERGYHEQSAAGHYRIVTPTTIRELADCIAGAAVFLGNDSGSAHLAGLLGIPSVVLFGATDPARWRPLGGRCVTLRASDHTLTGVAVDDVTAALTAISTAHD